jgi:septal ring factor EnvC (AmiA/AmiB activator)
MSSARYKRVIHDMDAASSNLMKLRPVSFRYKDDPAGTLQYGLVAEEVEKLYPQLVTHAADGQMQSVRYSMLTGMLLNELQKQARENEQQAKQIKALSTLMAEQKATDERRALATDREIAELKAGHARDLREIRADFAQRLATLERMAAREGNAKMAAAFEQ